MECDGCVCGRKFTSMTGFYRHREIVRWPVVRCVDPATLGMAQDELGRWLA